MADIKTRCLIIGSGPAGYTAAIYTSRANISPLVIEGIQPGGQLTQTTEVENFPGYPQGVLGTQLMEDLRNQALRFGADIRSGIVTSVDFGERPFIATTDSGLTIEADTIIICTGASAKYLGIEDEKKYNGLGVSACATCDGFFYRKRKVAVVGGGDTACEEALYLSNLASEVYLIVRKPFLRASKVMQDRVMNKENIHVLFNTNTAGLYGTDFVEGAHLVEHLGTDQERRYDLPIDGFFLAIGHKPNTDIFRPMIECDEQGYIKVKAPGTATNIEGVYAAGDVADPIYRQAIAAAGSGCKAALDVERFLSEH
ncbi:MAG: thioredoxin-disulfide reductase [Duncaniella sp.]|nr:thioredoxin-disulfide reductase [Duncaniella sp.]